MENGINGPLLNILSSLYSSTPYRLRTTAGVSDSIASTAGVKQGCVLSPTLFNIYMNDMPKYLCNSKSNFPLINEIPVSHLSFGDDPVLFSRTHASLQNSINQLVKFRHNWNLSINLQKSKIMTFNLNGKKIHGQFSFKNQTIELVSFYTYLGVAITNNSSFKCAMAELTKKARRA